MTTTVTIPIEEYEKLKQGECVIQINNFMTHTLEKEIMRYRLMLLIMKDEDHFKHDTINVPTVGNFSVSELKKEIEELK